MHREIAKEMLQFLKESPTAFHAVQTMQKELEKNGYKRLRESEKWEIAPGGAYYVTRNDSSLIAFCPGTELSDYTFNITASHSDFPVFKLKENAEIEVRKKYMQLNTEGYGGMLPATWFDRPLSVAGRVIVKEGNRFVTKLVNIDRDFVLIPSLAIHMNREAADGIKFNKQVDMLPLMGTGNISKGELKNILCKELGISPEAFYGSDLYLYNRQEPSVWGAAEEFISSQHLDDLQCAFACLKGFLAGENSRSVGIYACFDNEETGSGTKQGAGSTFLEDVLRRINTALGKTEEDYLRAISGSFMLSADNAHAVHPNHPEKTDETNCVYMNEGIVIKSHAGAKYTSDAVSIALFRALCENAGVPVQFFANRSDQQGGSTLGNILTGKVSLNAVDIGLAQLAMHSAFETAGIKDTYYMVKAVEKFFNSHFCERDGVFCIEE